MTGTPVLVSVVFEGDESSACLPSSFPPPPSFLPEHENDDKIQKRRSQFSWPLGPLPSLSFFPLPSTIHIMQNLKIVGSRCRGRSGERMDGVPRITSYFIHSLKTQNRWAAAAALPLRKRAEKKEEVFQFDVAAGRNFSSFLPVFAPQN